MLVVGPLFLLVLIVVAVLLLAPAAIDLVNRSDELSIWWAVPFVLVPLPVLVLVLIPLGERSTIDRSTMAATSLVFAHLALTAFFAVLGLGMAASRGLRPNGPTQRRRRSSMAAGALLMMPLVLPAFSVSLFWMVPGCIVGVLWVVAMNRRGPSRLERGKALSAGLLVASAIQAGWVLAHGAWYTDLDGLHSGFVITSWELIPAAAVLGILVAGLRFLSGSVHPLFPVVSLCSGVWIAMPVARWSERAPIPDHEPLPEWVDLMGNPGDQLDRVRRPECFWSLGQPRAKRYPCRYYVYALLAAETPQSTVPEFTMIVVGDGERAVQPSAYRWGPALHVREVDGLAQVDGISGSHVLGAELHGILSSADHAERPLRVHASPNWTVQDYVSMCASTGNGPKCMLVPE